MTFVVTKLKPHFLLLAIAMTTTFVSFLPSGARADQAHRIASAPAAQAAIIADHLTLDGVDYPRQDLLAAFTEIAFSSYIHPNDFPNADYAIPFKLCDPSQEADKGSPLKRFSNSADGFLRGDFLLCTTPTEFRQHYSWLYEYLYRDRGFPRFFAINKWTAPIRISTGYPNDLVPPTFPSGKDLPKYMPFYYDPRTGIFIGDSSVEAAHHKPTSGPPVTEPTSVVADEVRTDIRELSQLTNLSISYVSHEQEQADNVAQVRIVLADNPADWHTQFKRSAVMPSGQVPEVKMTSGGGSGGLAKHSAIDFRDFESYLATAVPFTPFSERQVDGFLLPNADNSIGMAFCFISNKNDAAVLRALVRECLVRSLGLPNAPRLRPGMILGLWNDQTSNLAIAERWKASTPPITSFDKSMVKMLYSPEVKPGQSVNEFYKAVSNVK